MSERAGTSSGAGRLVAPASAVAGAAAVLVLGSVASVPLGVAAAIVVALALASALWLAGSPAESAPKNADPLTGLGTTEDARRHLLQQVALAAGQGEAVSLILLDVDGFRAVNDAFGRDHGDEVLRGIARELQGVVRPMDSVSRIEGNSFALVAAGTDREGAFDIAERVRAVVAHVDAGGPPLASSAGTATYPSDDPDPDGLWQRAEAALGWAKERGKQRTCRFDATHTPLGDRDANATEIAELLALPQPIEPSFQPIVSLANGRVVGYEALARFTSTDQPAPLPWFAKAKRCGMGPRLEAAAIRAALEAPGRPLGTYLTVNVSPQSLASREVGEALPVDLTDIVIEVTEQEFGPDDDDVAHAIAALRERGARIAIDDAGAGYSGLNQVMRVKPDIVKLDRELVDGVHADRARTALIEAFVRFCREIGATVCAEGIETLEDLTILAHLDVELGQGYVLGKPAPNWPAVLPLAVHACEHAAAADLHGKLAESPIMFACDRRMAQMSDWLGTATSPQDLGPVLSMLAEEIGADRLVLSRFDRMSGAIEAIAEVGGSVGRQAVFSVERLTPMADALAEGIPTEVLAGGPDLRKPERALLAEWGTAGLLIVPVLAHGECVGVIEVHREHERASARTEINRARTIANQIGSTVLAGATTARDRHAVSSIGS